MTDSNLRRRLANDGMSPAEVEDMLCDLTNQRNDEARDRAAEKHFEGQV